MAAQLPSSFHPRFHQAILSERQIRDWLIPCQWRKRNCFSLKLGYGAHHGPHRSSDKFVVFVQDVQPDIEVSLPSFEAFNVVRSYKDKDDELTITVEVSGTKTQEIYDAVFSKMVADAQPIPGFRQVKGGKTPNIPNDILLEILGPSNVYRQVIKKIIGSTVAEYVMKECFAVNKDLRVLQSFEDLEAKFEPGDKFSFDAIVSLKSKQ